MNNYFALPLELDFHIQDKQEELEKLNTRLEEFRGEYKKINEQLKEVSLLDKLINEIDSVGFKDTQLYKTITTKLDVPDIDSLLLNQKELEAVFSEVEYIKKHKSNSGQNFKNAEYRWFSNDFKDTLFAMDQAKKMKNVVQANYNVIQFSAITIFNNRINAYEKGIRISGHDFYTDALINLMIQRMFGCSYCPMKLIFSFNSRENHNNTETSKATTTIPSIYRIDEVEEKMTSEDGLKISIDELKQHILKDASYFAYSRTSEKDKLSKHWEQYANSLDSLHDLEDAKYVELVKKIADDLRAIRNNY